MDHLEDWKKFRERKHKWYDLPTGCNFFVTENKAIDIFSLLKYQKCIVYKVRFKKQQRVITCSFLLSEQDSTERQTRDQRIAHA